MEFAIEQAIEVLRNTPEVLSAMLGGLSEPWIMNNYGDGTFSPFDVVGHLIHGERSDWIPRAKIIMAHVQDQPFETFDRTAMYTASAGKNISDLLDTFEGLRTENLQILQTMDLQKRDLQRRGTHPELSTVTMTELLAMWVVHDLNHVAQIAKAMAFQYRDTVGPWKPYASILS